MTSSEHHHHLEKVTQYYDTAQKYYNLMWGEGLHYGLWTEDVTDRAGAIEKENEILADLVGISKGDYVLDAGCGVGNSGIWLAKQRVANVIELNITGSQLLIAQKQAEEKNVAPFLDIVQADYHTLPLISESCDVFWSLESIEHSDNIPLVISEAYRTLKKGGRAMIAGTFKGPIEPNQKQFNRLQTGMRAAGAFNDFRSASDTITLMSRAGFGNFSHYDATSFVMKSAQEMHDMCSLGLPGAKLLNKMGIVSDIMVYNTAWGTYQNDLFRSAVTSYDIITAHKE